MFVFAHIDQPFHCWFSDASDAANGIFILVSILFSIFAVVGVVIVNDCLLKANEEKERHTLRTRSLGSVHCIGVYVCVSVFFYK